MGTQDSWALVAVVFFRSRRAKTSLLAKVVAWLSTPDAVMAALNLLDDDAKPPIPYDTWKQMEDAFIERKPYGGTQNSYTQSPRSSNEVRARLFAMSRGDKRRAKAAARRLAQIELWRLEHGKPLGEPQSIEVENKSFLADTQPSSLPRRIGFSLHSAARPIALVSGCSK